MLDLLKSNNTERRLKHLALAVCILLSPAYISAQTQKGNYLPGGSADASLSFTYTTRSFNISMQPTFAVFVVNNLAVGAIYSFGAYGSHTVSSTHVGKETDNFVTSLGPYMKYYIGKKALKGAISANAGYELGTGVRTETNRSPTQADEGLIAGGTAALAYFFNPHLSLEPGLYINVSAYQTVLPITRIGFSLALFVFLEKAKPAAAQ